MQGILVVNTETIPGMMITETLGVVSGSTVRAKNLGRDITQGLRNIMGGELVKYTELLESRQEAIGRMVAEAMSGGATAIVNVRFATSAVTAGAAELFAYGTAVKAEWESVSMADPPIVILVLSVCILPFLLLAIFEFSGQSHIQPCSFMLSCLVVKKLNEQIEDTTSREISLRESLGRNPLTTVDGGYRTNITDCGVVWAGVVFGPSHWHLLIGKINNLIGGSIDIFQKVVAAGRAEAMQRLRENAVANGWDDVINVRIDTSDMAPQGSQSTVKAVEVFAYGTGVKYG